MSDVYAELGAAIAEVKKARKLVMKKKTKQVTAAGEIEQLRSTALAWVQTHQPSVEHLCPGINLAAVDAAYQKVLVAVEKVAARDTYADALCDAKNALVAVRGSIAAVQKFAPAGATTDAPPNFASLVNNPPMQAILVRRWKEIQACIGAGADLAATVMMGGMLESLLLARINGSPNRSAVFTAASAPRNKANNTLPLAEWKLVKMVEVGYELGWITKSGRDLGNVLRDFRNYIHPHKEHADGVVISSEDTQIFWEVTKAISRQVLNSVSKSP